MRISIVIFVMFYNVFVQSKLCVLYSFWSSEVVQMTCVLRICLCVYDVCSNSAFKNIQICCTTYFSRIFMVALRSRCGHYIFAL